jgi:hypothetical protein
MREIAEFEMVCTRSEYVSMANTMARLLGERDAAIRDRKEFAASEVERFGKDTLPPTGPLCGATTLDHAIRIRAAELRKAAGAAAPPEPTTSVFPPSHRRMAKGYAATPAADARQPAYQQPSQEMEHYREMGRQTALMECAMAAGIWDIGQTVSPSITETFPQAIADKLAALEARLAASEKAKAELLDLAESLVGECDGVEVWRRLFQSDKLNVVGHSIKDMDMASQKLKAAIAAERAGGAQ